MIRRRFLGAAASVGALAWRDGAGRVLGQEPGPRPPIRPDDRINAVLEAARTGGRRLPGMIGAVVRGEEVVALGAVGVRKIGSPEPIRVDDVVHVGSCTKAMTATMIGTLVDEGRLGWGATLGEVFPDRAPDLHPDSRKVTLRQLLAHRAGLPHDVPWRSLGPGKSPTDQRRALLGRVLREAPRDRPGTKYAYSNVGYVLAGLMAEQVAQAPWEELMRRRVFGPLGMASAGFGVPGTPGRVDQPWGHREAQGELRPIQLDNPPAMGPAGTVHCSLPDWARFAMLHTRGSVGGVRILKPEALRALHTPEPGQEYAGGWIVVERSWAGGTALTHSGSNTTWYCTIWLAPARDLALLVATNAGSESASQACDEAIGGMLRFDAGLRSGRR